MGSISIWGNQLFHHERSVLTLVSLCHPAIYGICDKKINTFIAGACSSSGQESKYAQRVGPRAAAAAGAHSPAPGLLSAARAQAEEDQGDAR